MSDTIKTDIRAFIIENFLFGDTSYALEDDASLIENSLIDSTGVLELVLFLEQRFGISVGDAEIVPANLDSVTAMARFIDSKTVAAMA